jgi:hypothetical protein
MAGFAQPVIKISQTATAMQARPRQFVGWWQVLGTLGCLEKTIRYLPLQQLTLKVEWMTSFPDHHSMQPPGNIIRFLEEASRLPAGG